MLTHLLREPDALALMLLLICCAAAAAVGWGKVEGKGGEGDVTTWPHLLRVELLAAMVVMLGLCWWALILGLPLDRMADPRLTPGLAKAPWFFVGIQEMLQYFDTWLAGAVLPVLMVTGLCLLPYLERGAGKTVPRLVLGLLALFWFVPMILGQLLRGEHWALQPAWQPALVEGPSPATAGTLGQALGLAGTAAQVPGAVTCLLPLALLPLAWWRLRRRPWAARMGHARFALAGALLLVLAGVALKVLLHVALDVRYLWVTPWFRL